MAITRTTICNLAIARVGSELITDLDTDVADNVKSAVACQNVFDHVLMEVARAGRWNCLKTRAILPKPDCGPPTFDQAPLFQWTYAYQLPENCVRLIQFNGEFVDTRIKSQFFEIERRKILTDAEVAEIQYIAACDNFNDWDPMLIECMVVLLASKIAFTLRQDGGVEQSLRTEYERITLPKARSRNGNEIHERARDPGRNSSFLSARWTSTRR